MSCPNTNSAPNSGGCCNPLQIEVMGPGAIDLMMTNPAFIGTRDYNYLLNQPQINSVTLKGNKSFDDLGLSALTNMELRNLLR